jgi:hypothetical protein
MRRPAVGSDRRASAGISDKEARKGAHYFGNRNQPIHRHTESIDLSADQSARWGLAVDFELPTDREAQCGAHNGEALYLFPLLYLRKAEGRTGFTAVDEQGTGIPLPNRSTCDRISALAAADLAIRLLEEASDANGEAFPELPRASVEHVFESICVWRAYDASVILNHLLKEFDSEIIRVWYQAGLIEDLEMLVDHSFVWVPLRGLPGERRRIELGTDIELSRRSLRRWHFGELKHPRFPRIRRRRAKQLSDRSQVLSTGEAKYGRVTRRISLSVLGERLVQPLGWLPIEFDFPTIYTRRCSSYHFELNCPRGLSPRGIKVALDSEEDKKKVPGRTTIRDRRAHVYLPKIAGRGDVIFRATVGIGTGTFPLLWVLMGAITTAILWSLVGFNPNWLVAGDTESHNEIAAAVLLVVPALLGAMIIGTDDEAVSTLISGSRILLLVTGLCCVAATAVLIGVEPFSTKPQATWAVCAAIATAATVPLATSWLRSLPSVWRGLAVLNSVTRQYIALFAQLGVALFLAVLLSDAVGDTAVRAGYAIGLLVLTVTLTLLATNHLPIEMEDDRRFVSVGAMIGASACLILACLELQRIFAPNARWQIDVASVEQWILVLAPSAGLLLWLVTLVFGPKAEQLSVSPAVGRRLVAGERIRELRRLRELDPSADSRRFRDLPATARSVLERIR